ncbi:divalent metal cation transporter [Synechococcus sp. YX-04-1]|uniref:NRAMP family divalent metal transporter n=1 Tax=Synechococcus sp. YX-04-1 TaxID=3062778 RepID=UPI0026E12D67|nr:divalent metal cation transporter [Synechococcus sp. YX-04-1]MDO6351417.1 divalent metal cation transporter [Synechococcus sp. YX-04-1]
MASSTLRRSIGPGILLAGACIGGSHLMSSTTAGARFGFALVGLILLTNLIKYPFLRVGTRFTAATGLSLLEGFQKRNSLYLPLYLVVSLVTGTFTIAAVSFVAGLLLTNIPLLAGLDPYGLSIAVLVVSGLVLLLGHYRALDRLSKLLVVLLTLLTGVAAASLLIRGPVGDVAASWVSTDPSPWTLANLAFLIPLMGWMPGPVEMCVWPSLWMFSRARDTDHTATPKEAEFDFNLGYSVTVVTAMFFVILGAYTMYGSGDGMLAGSGVSFAQKLIKLYTAAMGGWAAWVIIPAAFSAMFSTTLTCLDAYPRSIAAIQGLLRHHDSGDSAPGPMQRRFDIWVIVHFLAAVLALVVAKTGGIGVKDFVFGAMTGSFLTAPLFAWMAMDTINSPLVPLEHRYGRLTQAFCWFGLVFFSGFSLLFIGRFFLGLGGRFRLGFNKKPLPSAGVGLPFFSSWWVGLVQPKAGQCSLPDQLSTFTETLVCSTALPALISRMPSR